MPSCARPHTHLVPGEAQVFVGCRPGAARAKPAAEPIVTVSVSACEREPLQRPRTPERVQLSRVSFDFHVYAHADVDAASSFVLCSPRSLDEQRSVPRHPRLPRRRQQPPSHPLSPSLSHSNRRSASASATAHQASFPSSLLPKMACRSARGQACHGQLRS